MLNAVHALLTGEPLFGRFEVVSKPDRVLLLSPESGMISLGKRIKNLGLAKFVGESLYYSSMNSDPFKLNDPRLQPAVKGAVVIVDTAIRFLDGD